MHQSIETNHYTVAVGYASGISIDGHFEIGTNRGKTLI